MRIDRRAVLGGAAIVAGVAASARASTRKEGGGPAHAKSLAALKTYVEMHRADWGLPGMTACAVTKTGFTGFVMSGLADVDRRVRVGPDHLFQIGSISKMLAALAIWSLVDEGKLSPEARVKDLLPTFPIRDGENITLQHLLNHTSGLPSDPPLIVDGGLWTGFSPGSRWRYCNTGYQMIGLIAAQADGRPFPECVEARVLKPLGMTQSVGAIRVADRERYARGYELAYSDRPPLSPGPMTPAPWIESENAAGCIAATPHDMSLFLRYLIDLAGGKGAPVLSDAAAAKFLADPADAPGWREGATYGNGIVRLEIDGRKYLHHTGGMVSFSSSLHVDVEAGVAAFASANVHYGLAYRPRDVTIYACKLLHAAESGAAAPSPAPTRPKLEKPEQFAGVFTAASGDSFEIVAGGDRIFMRRNGRDSEMQGAGDGFFACREPGFDVTGLKFDVENDKAVRAWAGNVEYAADPAAGYRPPSPAALLALAGRYDSDDRWSGTTYVYARDGKLWLGAEPLMPLANGEWRAGAEDWSPERVRFDGVVSGRPQRMLFSGFPFYRRFG
ncbi:MAG: serine hydrolase domain-containing protein [Parvularculaceae bacterium]